MKALIQSNQGFFRAFQNFEKTSGKRRACLRVGNAAQERQNHAVNTAISWYSGAAALTRRRRSRAAIRNKLQHRLSSVWIFCPRAEVMSLIRFTTSLAIPSRRTFGRHSALYTSTTLNASAHNTRRIIHRNLNKLRTPCGACFFVLSIRFYLKIL